ncbi:NHS-like protein 3 isoform X2 [Genypterus blacodes]|uniref:NHS-like protein 3 isoform X2 n=1 Tax=Genypterus blacodes TaxID=154954 RepID=UPI003F76812C
MGNSIHKKKKKVQAEKSFSFSSSPSRDKTKTSWLFGRQKRLKTAGPKGHEDQKRLTVHYTTSQHYQENVFIEGSRPQYLEDLHTEAQEGLKILQQEENKNGVSFPDDESIASTYTLRAEQDINSKDEGGSLKLSSTAGNTDITVTSAVSAASSRSVLTRQGSTFKPLNPVKRPEKTRKRSRRTTIMGIPTQVQKELALHRSSTFQPLVPSQLLNQDRHVSDGQSGVVVIPTIDGGSPLAHKEGARVHLPELEACRDEHLLVHHLQAVYQDEQPFTHQSFGSRLSPTSIQRPKSVAVPGMTTSSSSSFSPSTILSFLQEPQGPVMSISPQATYLSKIIPNAVLPAAVEVIEIDRSISRTRGNSINYGGSIRAVSKSSLASGDSVSPLLSRRSDCGGANTDYHNNSMLMPTSASGSHRSQSQSPSPISSKGSKGNPQTVVLTEQESQPKQSGVDQDLVSLCSSVSTGSKGEHFVQLPGSESGVSGYITLVENTSNSRNSTRGLSVTKTKLPPAPPQRTNSLHTNKFTNNRAPVDSKAQDDALLGEVGKATEKLVTADTSKTLPLISNSAVSTSPDDSQSQASSSPFSPTQTSSRLSGGPPESKSESSSSSPQKTPSEGGKFERTMSPSSGYSSQSGTPTLSPKGMSPTSPDKLKKKPVKPERSASRASAASPSDSLTSLLSNTSEHVSQDVSNGGTIVHQQGPLPSVVVTEITPANNCSTATLAIRELLNIPPHPKVTAPCPPPPETWAHNRRSFELLCGPCPNVSKLNQLQEPEQLQNSTNEQTGNQTEASKMQQVLVEEQTEMSQSTEKVLEDEPQPFLATFTESVSKEQDDRECPSTEQERLLILERVKASVEVQRQEEIDVPLVKDTESSEAMPKKEPPPVMKKTTRVSHRREESVERQQKEFSCSVMTVDDSPTENFTSSLQSGEMFLDSKIETLSVDMPKMNKLSPPHTPPPAHHPTPPPSRKTPPSSVSMLPADLPKVQDEIHIAESCWPPPPPPLEGDYEGGDEVDFPPPPPPPFMSDVMDRCIEFDVSNGSDVAEGDISETITDSAEAGKIDLPTTNSQTEVIENKEEEDTEVTTDDTADEKSFRPAQIISSLPDNVHPPPSYLTHAEKTLLVSSSVPPSCLVKPDILKVEDQHPSEPVFNTQLPPPVSVPAAPPLPVENFTPGVNFRKQPSLANRDSRSKDPLSRKSAPIPKEDANIPLVTPSLLQMVRLRTVNMTEDQINVSSEDKSTNGEAPIQGNGPLSISGPLNVPQKPIRKSLSLKSPHHTVKKSSVTLHTPSMRLQEAIRMKTAAMSSRDGLPSRLGLRSSPYSCVGEPGSLFGKSDGCDVHKSPASTASFIFSRSTKKVVVETVVPATPETQAGLKQSLAAELMQVSDRSKVVAVSNGELKSDKVPPPVAKKPAPGNTDPSHKPPVCSAMMELNMQENGEKGAVQPTETTTRVTADTIETLF